MPQSYIRLLKLVQKVNKARTRQSSMFRMDHISKCGIFLLITLSSVYGTKSITSTSKCEVCPPWTECNNSKCICKDNFENYLSFKCDNQTLQLSVIRCHCLTLDNQTQEFVEGNCIENCENGYTQSDFLPLPLDVSTINQFMCEERWNRTGRLCGKCLPGYSPLAYSYDMRCVKCPEGNANVWKYILVAFSPLTVFYFFILFLKINATSSHLHGYLIFSQIISAPVLYRNITIYLRNHPKYSVPIKLMATMYSIWNLDFFRSLYPDICLDLSPLSVMALDYAVAIYPLLLTVVSYVLIKLHARNVQIVVILWKPFRCVFTLVRRNWDTRTTVIDAYTTFFVLAYTKILSVSADLLIPTRAHNINKDSVTWVLYYDATVDYFGTEHLPYGILALMFVVLALVFPTANMLLYQTRWYQKVLHCLKVRTQMLQAVMNSLQGGYKDGTEPGTRDYRWFAAVPLIGRITLLVTFALILDSSFLPMVVLIIIFIIVLTATFQPYKQHLSANTKVDIIFWAFLAAFYTLDAAASYSRLKPLQILTIYNALRLVVPILPLLYMICVTVYWILSRMIKLKTLITQMKAWRRGYANIDSDSLPDRMVNPEQYKGEQLEDPIGVDNSSLSVCSDSY